ncbi:hypothetical protein SKAU_G00227290 [Synaphobranchus kaupii]|uniref:Uncharacterized protein n=1 Tax=Synaphobranchus kaupii TaxID=118154 RepID=A0A9Q1F537_SYNKA|nr:hypothetical protein SKAU_G00227290 [Synaphobranchus kaupii]
MLIAVRTAPPSPCGRAVGPQRQRGERPLRLGLLDPRGNHPCTVSADRHVQNHSPCTFRIAKSSRVGEHAEAARPCLCGFSQSISGPAQLGPDPAQRRQGSVWEWQQVSADFRGKGFGIETYS